MGPTRTSTFFWRPTKTSRLYWEGDPQLEGRGGVSPSSPGPSCPVTTTLGGGLTAPQTPPNCPKQTQQITRPIKTLTFSWRPTETSRLYWEGDPQLGGPPDSSGPAPPPRVSPPAGGGVTRPPATSSRAGP